MKKLTKILSLLLAVAMCVNVLAACGVAQPDTETATYDEVVAWLTAEGFIAKDAVPVDINTTAGYVTDFTGGSCPFAPVADKAYDYDGLWLFWWDLENPTDNYQYFMDLGMTGGAIIVSGGAGVLRLSALSGAYAIAFDADYAQKDAAREAFVALSAE